MQPSHLIPHIDAEISRLQRARDLLLLYRAFLEPLSARNDSSLASHQASATIQALTAAAAKPLDESEASSRPESLPSSREVVITRVKQRRTYTRRDHSQHERKRRAAVVDTALRGSVPLGPVVVSAEEARKSQAAKAAQSTRAAEVKRAGAEIVSSLGWHSRSSDMRHVDALLQRLINLGEDDSDAVGRLTPHSRENFDTLGAPPVAKAD